MTTMALVRGPMRGAIVASSTFRVSGLQSAKIGVNPCIAKAFAVDTNVNEGTITSSLGRASTISADISSADVQELVRSAACALVSSRRRVSQACVNGPLPDSLPLRTTSDTQLSASGISVGRLNGMR